MRWYHYIILVVVIAGILYFATNAIVDFVDYLLSLIGLTPDSNPVAAPLFDFQSWVDSMINDFQEGASATLTDLQEGVSYLQQSIATGLNPYGDWLSSWIGSFFGVNPNG